MSRKEHILSAEAEIRMLDDKIEKLYNEGRDEEAKEYTKKWKEATIELDEYIALTKTPSKEGSYK